VHTLFTGQREGERKRERETEKEKEGDRERERGRERKSKSIKCRRAQSVPHSVSQSACAIIILISLIS
jgi:hypothetical protein